MSGRAETLRSSARVAVALAAPNSGASTLATQTVDQRQTVNWIELLKTLGVARWNQRRLDLPNDVPDFRNVDFTDDSVWKDSAVWKDDPNGSRGGHVVLYVDYVDDPHRPIGINLNSALLDGANLTAVSLRHADLSNASLKKTNLTGADLIGGTLTNADLFEAKLENTDFRYARLDGAGLDQAVEIETAQFSNASLVAAWFSTFGERTNLRGIDLSGCDLTSARLERADLSGANLRGAKFHSALLEGANFGAKGLRPAADLRDADFREANLCRANIRGCDLRETRWDGAKATGIRFGPLSGRCGGAGGIRGIYGNNRFQSQLLDHEFIDSMKSSVNEAPLFSPITAAIRAVLLGVVFYLAAKATTPLMSERGCRNAALIGVALGLFFGTRPGKQLLMWLWSWFKYGRSITRVAIFAFLAIAVIGFAYDHLRGEHLIIALPDETCRTLDPTGQAQNCRQLPAEYDISLHPAYPWFVATMGFCTLSMTDLMFPKTGLGQLVIMVNVLSGFLTLGLLLSVLADRFARRS